MQPAKKTDVVHIYAEQKECLQKARKNKGLERSFKMSISPEVYDTLEKEFDQLETE